jgi:hypothetical protein
MSHSANGFPYTVNDKKATTNDGTAGPDKLLADAGFEPADDYMLVQQTEHGTKLTSADDVIDIRDGLGCFFAFDAGTSYAVRLNTHGVVWGEKHIEVNLLRRFGQVPDDADLVDEATGQVLEPGKKFDLSQPGVEHLRTRKRAPVENSFVYYVGATEYKTHHERLTGAQIVAEIADWNAENSLVLEGEGEGPDETITPTTTVEFKGRTTPARFIIVPPATFGLA